MMWLFLVCIFPGLFKLSTAFSSFTLIDKYLFGYELRVAKVEDWFECIKQCQDEPLCVSYNFYDENVCQLNRHGVEDKCRAEQELSSKRGCIYHQIREVKKRRTRVKRDGSCPCNCGTPNQCYVEPGYGSVPEKRAGSCSDILERRGSSSSLPDGPYYLRGPAAPVYCHMTRIPECGNEAGWTLVMKINGSEETFAYDSKYWEGVLPGKKEYQPENGENLDECETKLQTFYTVTFDKICMGMKTANSSIHWLMKGFMSGTKTMITLFKDTKPRQLPFNYNTSTWLGLLPGSRLKGDNIKDGVNVASVSGDGGRVRIGAIAADDVPTSFIGFGAGGDASGMHLGVTCGNVNDSHFIPAYGYILVKQ